MRNGVVTPEAVLLDLPTAGVATRAFARMIDLVVQVVVGAVLALVGGWLVSVGLGGQFVALVVVVTSLLVVPVALEVLTRGRSLGKVLFALRVVGVDGAPVRPRQSMVRGLLAIVEIYLTLGFLALMTAMLSPAAQRLGDLAAATVVVRESRGDKGTAPVVFFPPPGFEAYVANLDVGRLGADDFALIRSFLLRVGSLERTARAHRATELAEAVRLRIDHDLPGWVDPETWLVCVASAYQWREGGLLRDVALGRAPVAAPVAVHRR